MRVAVGLDLGTTSVVAVAVADGATVAQASRATPPRTTAAENVSRGYAEYDADGMVRAGCEVLKELSGRLPPGCEVVGLGMTGQQHGGLVMDPVARRAVTPLINWQDRRALEAMLGTGHTWLDAARDRLGESALETTGCRLSPGFLAVTLFRLVREGLPTRGVRACFLTDYVGAMLTDGEPVCEASMGGSAGVYDIHRRSWSANLLGALELPTGLMPEIVPAKTPYGKLTPAMASRTGFPTGLPVMVGIGDHQASYLGSVSDREGGLFVNVGTGAQVAQWSSVGRPTPIVEARPFPGGCFLHTAAGLPGGAAYAVFEAFVRRIATEVFGVADPGGAFDRLNNLAGRAANDVPVCEPFFSGTRADPSRRGAWHGLSPLNLTPAHLARSLLEGIAQALAGARQTVEACSGRAATTLFGAGNGLRENEVLATMVGAHMGMKLNVAQREEAARGAATQV